MSQAKHTPGPWVVDGDVIRGDQQRNGSISVASMLDVSYPYGRRAGESKHANARLIAAAPELLEALEEYRIAHAMSSYGDYSAIEWESKAGTVNPNWGGGDCEKHGRWYGMCHCCRDEWKRLCDQSDRDAVRARNNALRAADDKANAAIAKATGCE